MACCNCRTCKDRYCAGKVSLFRGLDEHHIMEVVNKIQHLSFQKGDIIFSAGDDANRLFIINKGSMKVYHYTLDGKEQILYILTEGDFLGDLNLFREGVMEYYASALEDTLLCTLSKEDFNEVIIQNPEINIKMLDYAYERITNLEHLVQTLTTKDVDARLSTLLLNLSKSFGLKREHSIEITFPLSREDMASYLGLTRETISRRLAHLQNEGVISQIGNKKIIIEDIEKLSSLSLPLDV